MCQDVAKVTVASGRTVMVAYIVRKCENQAKMKNLTKGESTKRTNMQNSQYESVYMYGGLHRNLRLWSVIPTVVARNWQDGTR